jgi:hypothetical protein
VTVAILHRGLVAHAVITQNTMLQLFQTVHWA